MCSVVRRIRRRADNRPLVLLLRRGAALRSRTLGRGAARTARCRRRRSRRFGRLCAPFSRGVAPRAARLRRRGSPRRGFGIRFRGLPRNRTRPNSVARRARRRIRRRRHWRQQGQRRHADRRRPAATPPPFAPQERLAREGQPCPYLTRKALALALGGGSLICTQRIGFFMNSRRH